MTNEIERTYRFGISSEKLNRSIYEFVPRNYVNHLDSAERTKGGDFNSMQISGRWKNLDGAEAEAEREKYIYMYGEKKIKE